MSNPITYLPPFEVHETGYFSALSQTMGWGLADLNVPQLWSETSGENVTLAFVDTGYSPHFETKDAIDFDRSISLIQDEPTDGNGHGTMTIGVCAAKNDENGIAGICDKSKFIYIKALPNSGILTNQNILTKALRYAINCNVDIINFSLGGYGRYEKEFEDLVDLAYSKNIVIVASAGNDPNRGVCYPAAYEKVIASSSYSQNRVISKFCPAGYSVDFCMPGDKIITTALNDQYSVVSGTSFSAPFLSGIIALLISHYKKINKPYTVDSIVQTLKKHCIKPTGKDYDERFGYGIVNIKDLKNID